MREASDPRRKHAHLENHYRFHLDPATRRDGRRPRRIPAAPAEPATRDTVMIFRSPYPDVTIPDVPLATYRPPPRRPAGRQTGADRRIVRADPYLRRPGRTGPRGRGRTCGSAASARAMSSGIYAPNCLDYAVALLAVAARRRHRHDGQPPRDGGRAGPPARRRGCILAPHRPRAARPGPRGHGLRPVREVFVVGEAAGATPFADLVQKGGDRPDVAIDRGRCRPASLLQRHDRAARRA